MTIKSLVNDYVCPQAGLKQFDALVSSTDQTARDIMNAAIEAGEMITRRTEWTRLFRTATVGGGVASFTDPADMHRLIQGGAIVLNGDGYSPVLPITSPDQWQFLSKRPSTQAYYRLGNGVIEFSPALPASGAVVNYVSKNWVSGGGDTFTSDNDTIVFPEQLLAKGIVYRFKKAKRQAYQDYETEFEAMLEREIQADRGIA